MINLNNIKPYATIATYLKLIKEEYKCDISPYELHNIFEELHISSQERIYKTKKVKVYKKSDVEYFLNNGYIKNRIDRLLNYKGLYHNQNKLPVSYSTPPQNPIARKRNGKFIIQNPDITKHNIETGESFENDMEAYSNYLINHVYEAVINELKKVMRD
jgi:hypothetical protein